jgi:NAD(P)H-dependent FMN reductase
MAGTKPKNVAIITSSTRVVRVGPHIAKFVTEILNPEVKDTDITLSQVDIATFKLPVFDEPILPALVPLFGQFEHEHSKEWSAEMNKYDGYVLIVPTYNRGPPGGVKNALDYLYNEIKNKPWLIIGYGAGGANDASDSLKNTLEGMQCKTTATRPWLVFSTEEKNEMGVSKDVKLTWEGKLGDYSLKKWQNQREEITKGFGELKGFLNEVFTEEGKPTAA